MQILFTIFTTILFICSTLGYMTFLYVKLHLQSEFIPIVSLSSIACGVYFCGLIGHLLSGSFLILGLGLLLLIYCVWHMFHTQTYPKIKPTLFQVVFGIGCVLFFHILLITRLIHYDNFSHWAIVVKQMISTNAFPDAASTMIEYKNYPLGTSSFLYYVCLFLGHSQPVMLVGQGLLIFSSFYAIFGIITEKKRFLLYTFLGAGCSLLSFFNLTIRINNLLVDFLLPIYTLALFAIIYQYRNNLKKCCIAIIPVAGFLMIIKSTGIIFAAIGLLFFIFSMVKHRTLSLLKTVGMLIGSLLATLIPYLLWMWHMATVMKDTSSKFEVSTSSLSGSSSKSADEINQIISLFIHSVCDLSTRATIGIIVFNVVAIVTSIGVFFIFHKKWNLWKALIALDIVLVCYYIGILSLYIFSMPLSEAITLAGFERYSSSIVVLFAGGLVLCATVDIENSFYYRIGEVPDYMAYKSPESKHRYQQGIEVFLALAILVLLSEYNGLLTIQQSYETTLPYKVSQITGDRWYSGGETDDQRYLCYASDTDSQVTDYYLQYITRYMLFAPNVDGLCSFYEDNLMNLLSSYDYLIIVEQDDEESSLLQKYFNVSGEPGIYRIIKDQDQIQLELE